MHSDGLSVRDESFLKREAIKIAYKKKRDGSYVLRPGGEDLLLSIIDEPELEKLKIRIVQKKKDLPESIIDKFLDHEKPSRESERQIWELAKEIMSSDDESSTSKNKMYREVRSILEKLETELYQEIEKTYIKVFESKSKIVSRIEKRIKEVCDFFHLGENERALLQFFIVISFEEQCSKFFCDRDYLEERISIKMASKFVSLKKRDFEHLLREDKLLVSTGLLQKQYRGIRLGDYLTDHLIDGKKQEFSSKIFVEKKPSQTIPLKDFNIDHTNLELMKNLMKSNAGFQILIHGNPGVGKTEFVKNLAKSYGCKAIFLAEGDGKEAANRRFALSACANIINTEQNLIVVDEADRLINSETSWRYSGEPMDKSWLNGFLENSKHKIIWISNEIEGVPESTKRRFTFSFELKNLNRKQRLSVLNKQIKKHKISFIKDPEIQDYIQDLNLSPAIISKAIETIKSLPQKSIDGEETKHYLKQILSSHYNLIHEKLPSRPLDHTEKYNLDGVNTDFDLNNVISNVRHFIMKKSTNQLPCGVNNLNFLFWGPPGTGKTEFVKYLSNTLGTNLIQKRGSDLLSKWVGGTEKNIRDAFEEAEQENSILFLDEADSLFISRESAQRSWEVSQTNELLTHMETFNGVLICSTNFQNNLDPACLRRFSWKIKFNYLDKKQIEFFYKKYFGEESFEKLSNLDKRKLESIPQLSPGDFKVVQQRMAFSNPGQSKSLIHLLEMESKIKMDRAEKIIGI